MRHHTRMSLACAALLAGTVNAAQADDTALSSQARTLLQWISRTSNNGGMPFMIIDKRQAQVWVFNPQAQLRAHSPALMGLALGDDSVPGIGERPIPQIRPEERTTPAGRFVVEPGRNLNGEDIVWIDYDAAVSMHRVRPVDPAERRLQRLASPTPSDNRITYGCINVPPRFYDEHVKATFYAHRGVAYVLPEKRSLDEVFGLSGNGRPSASAQPAH